MGMHLALLASLTMTLAYSRSARAADDVQYNIDDATWSGDGCHFAGDKSGLEDAWFLENGPDLAVVFTNLSGRQNDKSRRFERQSRCLFEVPFTIPEGSFIAEWTQSVQYGIVKPAGGKAKITIASKLKGARGNILANLASYRREFKNKDTINSPLEVAYTQRDKFVKKSWCKRALTKFALQSEINVSVARSPKGEETLLAVDGLDARLTIDPNVQSCY